MRRRSVLVAVLVLSTFETCVAAVEGAGRATAQVATTTPPKSGPTIPVTRAPATTKATSSSSRAGATAPASTTAPKSTSSKSATSKSTASKSASSKSTQTKNAAAVARTQSGRLRPTAKPGKVVTPGKVTTTWSVQNPLAGWEQLRDIDWPQTGEALGVSSRKKSLDVRRGPSVGEPGLRFTTGRSSTGVATFLVIQDYGQWLQVAIPVRPNGTVGWVLSADVQRLVLSHRVVVDLSTNVMVIEHRGREIFRESIASGTGNTPTPTGLFYIREVVKETENGPYGPYVLGLSGYSEVLYSFQGGEGAIAIHGTNAPGTIGSNASFGCIRTTNDAIRNLVRQLPLGTPVEIVRQLSDLPTVRRIRAVPDPEPFEEAVVEELNAEAEGVDINSAPPYNAESIDYYEPTTTLAPTPVVATTTPSSDRAQTNDIQRSSPKMN